MRKALGARVQVSALTILLLVLMALARAGQAQIFDASKIDHPTNLAGTWLVKAGDDPAYSQPGFDDSSWTRMDAGRDLHAYFGSRPAVVWYRLRLHTSPEQKNLGLATFNLARAFEIYANGAPILKFGSVAPYAGCVPFAALSAAIPDKAVQSGSVVIAVRVAISPREWLQPIHKLNAAIRIGNSDTLERDNWLNVIGFFMLLWFEGLLGFAISVAALALYTSQQRRIEYLWMPVMGLTEIFGDFIDTYGALRPLPLWLYAATASTLAVNYLAISLTYFGFLRYRPPMWLRIYMGISFPVSAFISVGDAMGWFSQVPFAIAFVLMSFVPFGVAPWIALRSARRGNREAYVLLLSTFLGITVWIWCLAFFLGQFTSLRGLAGTLQALWHGVTLGPVQANADRIGALVFWISLAVVLILRSNRTSLEQAALKSEIEAAAEVQQMILPEQRVVLPGVAIESEYRPAREVGGDFFQIIPNAADGSLLIVAGDVAGKGLKAGMLVALLVGAIRTAFEKDSEPAAILGALNRRLLGRGDARATCLAMHIASDGAVTLANAGHLPPYLNGAPLEIDGSLPLGLIENLDCSSLKFQLSPSDRLLLVSDGVVEAADEQGNLFGFDRVLELVRTQPSALQIVEAA